jgi:hypothetical protein
VRKLEDLLVTLAARTSPQQIADPEYGHGGQLHDWSWWRRAEMAALAAVAATAPPTTPSVTFEAKRTVLLDVADSTDSSRRSHLLLRVKNPICPSSL